MVMGSVQIVAAIEGYCVGAGLSLACACDTIVAAEDARLGAGFGRIGLMHPSLVAPLLPEFAQAWGQALYEIRDNEEKDSAFRGLCTLVQNNPAGITKVSSLHWSRKTPT